MGMGDILCCCGSRGYQNADAYLQPLNIFQNRPPASLDDLLDKSSKTREKCWESLGTLEPLVLSHLINPALSGSPKWPALRQAFRVIKRPNGNTMIVSDGLSDPFDDVTLGDGNINGFGLEFFIESASDEIPEEVHNVKKCWQFQLLYTVSQLAAGHGGIRGIMDDMKLLSTEAEGVNEAIPEEHRTSLVNAQGRVGALLGLQDRQDEGSKTSGAFAGVPGKIEGMPLTDVLLVNIKLLTLQELKLITDKGAEGRRSLDSLFNDEKRLVSSLTRPSVV